MMTDEAGCSGKKTQWRVLVVDDQPVDLLEAQRAAAAERIHIIPALTVVDALLIARICHLDGVVVREPRADAVRTPQLVSLLRRFPSGERLPIVTMERQGTVPLDRAAFRTLHSEIRAVWSRAKVLLVDEDAGFLGRVMPLLQRAGMEPGIADPVDVLRAIDAVRPDVLLIGPGAEHTPARDAVREVRSTARWRDLPILVVAAPERVAEALRAGATGIVDLDRDDDHLVLLVRQHLERARAAAEQLDQDPLTGMLRPRAFLERAARACSLPGAPPRAVGLASVTLAGRGALLHERVLAEIASILAERSWPEEVLFCRWGASDLAFLCSAGLWDEVLGAVHLAADAVWKHMTAGIELPYRIEVRAAIGRQPEDGATIEELVFAADRRLARA
jgi:CheY-like chemotaxis protein